MHLKLLKADVKIADGVSVTWNRPVLAVKGKLGEVKREFRSLAVDIAVEGKRVLLQAKNATKREKREIGSTQSHIANMVKGVSEGHTYLLKICSGHFPMNVSVANNKITIKNFLGEKIPRVADLHGAKVTLEGDYITVTGADREKVGQCAASIEQLTRITDKDRRVFQDGCYIIKANEREFT